MTSPRRRDAGRRPGPVLALGLALALTLAACGDDTGGSGRSGEPTTTPDPSPTSYVGLTKRAAIAKAEAENRPWRITREDDETFVVTFDFQPDRVNFEIDGGKVTAASFG